MKLEIKILENYIVLTPLNEKFKNIDSSIAILKNAGDGAKKIIESTKSTKEQTEIERMTMEIEKRQAIIDLHRARPISVELPLAKVPELKGQPRVTSTPSYQQQIKKQSEKTKPLRQRKSLHYFGQFGFSADETTPVGVVSQIGLPSIYALLSVNTSFKSSHSRFGLGTSFKLNKKFQLHMNISWGEVQRSGQFTDTAGIAHSIAVKSNLSRLTVAIEFPLINKIQIQIGPMFNHLQTNYYINSAPSNLQLFHADGDDLFYALKPPYLITNSFSPKSNSNIKTWIGLQLNLLYTINFSRKPIRVKPK